MQIAYGRPYPVPAAICIFHAFRYLSEPMYHIWRFEVSITLSQRRNVTNLAVPFPTDICPLRLELSRYRVQRRFSGKRMRQRRSVFLSLFYFLFLFFYMRGSRRRIISRPKFTALMMNFHARFPARRDRINDDCEIFYVPMIIFYTGFFRTAII